MAVINPITTEKVDRVGIVIRRGRETVPGTPPSTLRAIAKISENLKTTPEKITSEESFPDRMQGETKLVSRAAGGQVSVYLRYNETCFEYLEEALWSTFDEDHSLASDQVTFTAADNSISIDPIHPAVFTGSGLDDLTASGTYSAIVTQTIEVEIDGNGTPDTFKWRAVAKDGTAGAWTETVAITGSAQTLVDGVDVTFAATTGHTIGDAWSIDCLVFDADDFAPYRTFLASGSAVSGNNIVWRIADDAAATSTKLILEWGTVSDEAAGSAITLAGVSMVGPGRTRHSVTYERAYPDGTFIPYVLQVASEIRMQANMKQFIRLDITYQGRGTDQRAMASVAGTLLDALEGEIADTTNNLTAFRENEAVDGNIRNLELSWNNQARNQELSMQDGPVGVAPGTVQMTGNLSGLLFYGDDRLDRAMADTASSLSAVIETTEGYLVVQFLRFKFTPDEPTAEGGEGDAELSLPYQAEPFTLPDGSRAYIIVTKIPKA